MKVFYSANRNGFFPEDILATIDEDSRPDDLVEISQSVYANCLEAPSRGERVVPGTRGKPKTVPLPGPSQEEVLQNNLQIRDQCLAGAAINMAPLSDAVDLGIATEAESALLIQWRKYRVALGRLDLSSLDIVWPQPPGDSSASEVEEST
jgi:hypothetical protein